MVLKRVVRELLPLVKHLFHSIPGAIYRIQQVLRVTLTVILTFRKLFFFLTPKKSFFCRLDVAVSALFQFRFGWKWLFRRRYVFRKYFWKVFWTSGEFFYLIKLKLIIAFSIWPTIIAEAKKLNSYQSPGLPWPNAWFFSEVFVLNIFL